MKLINTLLCEQQARCISKKLFEHLYSRAQRTDLFSPSFRKTLLSILDRVKRNNYRITQNQGDVFRKHVDYTFHTIPCNELKLNETIRKVGNKYVVYSEKKGKRLGTHDTRKEAEKQLQAIHIQQHNEVIKPADPSKVDEKELEIGIEVEKEHTDDPKEAEKIALQHLAEDPKYYSKLASLGLEEDKHEPMNPGILKKRLGKLSCSKVRAERAKLKDKGTTYAKALQRYLNYHCKD